MSEPTALDQGQARARFGRWGGAAVALLWLCSFSSLGFGMRSFHAHWAQRRDSLEAPGVIAVLENVPWAVWLVAGVAGALFWAAIYPRVALALSKSRADALLVVGLGASVGAGVVAFGVFGVALY